MNKSLDDVATADLAGCTTTAAMASAEAWDPDTYALALSEHIRDSKVPLDRQRERLAALAQVGTGADRAAADELARQFSILESLFHRFARAAHEISVTDHARNSVHAERFLSASLKAQRAAMATLSALKVLRDGAPTTPASGVLAPAGALETT